MKVENKKILLVEDDPNFGSILREYLSINGYDVTLAKNGIEGFEKFKKDIKSEINNAWKLSDEESKITSTAEKELTDIYQNYTPEVINPSNIKTEKRFIDAVSDGLRQSMQKHDNLIIMGQDIAD